MYVPRTEHRPLAVTELVEHEQRVIARAPKVTVVRRSLLSSMYRTLRTVHVQDHPPMRRAGHSSVHPLSVQSAQPFYVAVLGKYLGLEPAHGARARRRSVYASVSNDYPHRRVLGQPFSVVGILVARQTTVHRLPEKAHQSVLHVATAPTLLQTLTRRLRQSQCIVQLAAGQQPSVRGDCSAAKLQPYTSVETERGAWVGAFTHRVPPRTVRYQELEQWLTISLALMITTVLCYSATLGIAVTVYDTPCRVDMGNVGLYILAMIDRVHRP